MIKNERWEPSSRSPTDHAHTLLGASPSNLRALSPILEQFSTNYARFPNLAPTLQVDALPGLSALSDAVGKVLLSTFGSVTSPALLGPDPFRDSFAKQFHQVDDAVRAITRSIAKTLDTDRIIESAYPQNWRGHGVKYDTIEQMVFDEGIALSHAIRPTLARRLGGAKSEAARRRILRSEWRSVATDCRRALDRLDTRASRTRVTFAQQAIDAIQAGHTAAAQALLANLIDTCIGRDLDPDDTWKIRGRPNRKGQPGKRRPQDIRAFHEAIGDDTMWIAFTFGPIWRSYQTFDAERDAAIPNRFNRHATAHAVSHRQFSRTNTIQALLAATELIEAMALAG